MFFICRRVQVFDSTGKFLYAFGNTSNFDCPFGITVDEERNVVFVVDRTNNRVQVFDISGNFLWTMGRQGRADGELLEPCDVKMDKEVRLTLLLLQ
jgi:DNA-binding beta-propeller fold protein YncE